MPVPSEDLLQSYDVSRNQYDVLMEFYVEQMPLPFTFEDLARHIVHVWQYDPLLLPVFRDAVAACLDKGWIQIVTAELALQDAARWSQEDNACFLGSPFREGQLYLTETGGPLIEAICEKAEDVAGTPDYQRYMTGYVKYDWREHDTLLVAFSGNEAEIRSAAANPFSYTAEYRIVKFVELFEIGPWWRTRFRQIPHGYRFEVKIEPTI